MFNLKNPTSSFEQKNSFQFSLRLFDPLKPRLLSDRKERSHGQASREGIGRSGLNVRRLNQDLPRGFAWIHVGFYIDERG